MMRPFLRRLEHPALVGAIAAYGIAFGRLIFFGCDGTTFFETFFGTFAVAFVSSALSEFFYEDAKKALQQWWIRDGAQLTAIWMAVRAGFSFVGPWVPMVIVYCLFRRLDEHQTLINIKISVAGSFAAGFFYHLVDKLVRSWRHVTPSGASA